jgi:hypothetical protein
VKVCEICGRETGILDFIFQASSNEWLEIYSYSKSRGASLIEGLFLCFKNIFKKVNIFFNIFYMYDIKNNFKKIKNIILIYFK